MDEASYTPGPWEFGRVSAEKFGVYADSGYRVATVHDFNSRPENLSNARLIAAAPKLLQACRVAVGAGNDGDWQSAERVLLAAIREATGDQQ